MTELLTQLGPLAQGSGFEDWANVLFLIVVAILWLFGALIKTLSGKKSQPTQPGEEQTSAGRRRAGETWQERLVRKAEELQRRLEDEAGVEEPPKRRQPAREPVARTTPTPGGQITVRTGPRGESIMVYEPPQPPPAERKPPVARRRDVPPIVTAGRLSTTLSKVELSRREISEPMIQGLPPIMAEPTQPLEPDKVQLKDQSEPGGYGLTAIIDYSDPEALKKAVLHYEILGRPLALRDASDEKAAF